MAEHDEEFDRRITALMGLAHADAPAPDLAPLPAPRRTGRWLAAAAAVALIGAAGVALATRDDNSNTAVDTTGSPALTTGSTSGAESSTTRAVAVEPQDCTAPAVAQYDTVGSMHTIVESSQALEIELVALDAPWCPGGTGVVRVTATNVGAGQEELIPIQLILNGGMNKYQLTPTGGADATGGMSLAPGTSMTVDVEVAVPGVPPGFYSLQVYGFGPGTGVRIDGPLACATTDLSAVAGQGDGAGQHEMTTITVTNVGSTPCFLGKPVIVMGVDGNASGPVQIPFDDGGFFPVVDPRPSRVLRPGEATSQVLTSSNRGCLDGDHPPVQWSSLQLIFDPTASSAIDVTLGPDNFFQTKCGLALSGWTSPTS